MRQSTIVCALAEGLFGYRRSVCCLWLHTPQTADIFQQKLLDLKNENKSILLSSHILSEVERAADRIAVINAGQIIQSGTLAELQNVASSEVEVTTKVPAD